MKRAIFPGSFDPLTLGHCEIIKKATQVFDQVIVSVGNNSEKKYMFSLDQRLNFISSEFKNNSLVLVEKYDGLTAEFCKNKNIKHIVRGLRNPGDFEFEKKIALFNNSLEDIETIFFLTSPNNTFISSSMVREIIQNGGDYKKFVPDSVSA
ncbi:MAG: pantetheine-phosphate adenylyltransferase [Flavobacteriaceae bacterium]|nr:pantetheine-phosphate adenylyltransferase [Flavobacteriaceae bacterium]|tara:strand:+ start:1457 stop:1909 length:453 start_codon:yes stop_codon:yes gene_type:complete